MIVARRDSGQGGEASPLARLATQLRRHDWFAVGLELLLIVCGIFIGLQVDNWNRDRIEAREQRAAQVRLQRESEQVVAYFRAVSAMMERGRKGRTDAIRRLVTGDWTEATRDDIIDPLDSLRFAPAPAPPRSAYDELVGSGKFAGVGDVRLREAITSYYASLDFLQGQTNYVRDIIVLLEQRRNFPGIRLVRNSNPKDPLSREFDLAALARDQGYLYYITEGDYIQRRQADWWHDTLVAAEAMCQALARANESSCNPPKDSVQ